MGGITSGNASGWAGYDIPSLALATSLHIDNTSSKLQAVSTSFHRADYTPIAFLNGSWTEGTPIQHTQGFSNSTLTLTVMRPAIEAGSVVTVYVNRTNGLRPQCGMPQSYRVSHYHHPPTPPSQHIPMPVAGYPTGCEPQLT